MRWELSPRKAIHLFILIIYQSFASHDVESLAKKTLPDHKKNDLGEVDDKKKKKRSEKKSDLSNLINDEAPMSEGYMGGRISECPMLDSIEKKCRGIDIMSGDSHQNLLEACGAHQLCYLCVSLSRVTNLGQLLLTNESWLQGDSQLQCDYEYLNDAEEVCGRDGHCKVAARQVLSVLRNLAVARVPPRECIRNPCLNMARRSLSY